MTQLLELPGKDFKVVIVKMLQQAMTNMHETNKKLENLSRETEVIKKNQAEFLELKNTVTKILKLSQWA